MREPTASEKSLAWGAIALTTPQFRDFMLMGVSEICGRRIFQFKHSNTRHYLNVDHTAFCYRQLEDGGWEQIGSIEALQHALS
jgi:hypothetical protein